jgi:hypothetical protein
MSVVIQEPTARMSADHAGARAGLSYHVKDHTPMAVLHQTRNSGSIISGIIHDLAEVTAIKLTASVNVQAGNLADIQRRYEFHLLQLLWKPIDYALYAGKTAAEGSMKLDLAAPPLYPAATTFVLDADENAAPPFPFMERGDVKIRRVGTESTWLVSLEADDHPFADRPLQFPNFATESARGANDDKFNYLYEVSRSLCFFTVFVVKDLKTRTIKPLGFINWKSRILAKIRWRLDTDGAPVAERATLVTAYFTSDDYLPGTPNSEAKKMIVHPPTDPRQTSNAIERATFRAAYGSRSNSPSIQASNAWSASVPGTHFAP